MNEATHEAFRRVLLLFRGNLDYNVFCLRIEEEHTTTVLNRKGEPFPPTLSSNLQFDESEEESN
jgi:hypothetical protein